MSPTDFGSNLRMAAARAALGALRRVWRAMPERERRWLLFRTFAAERSDSATTLAAFCRRGFAMFRFPWTAYGDLYDPDRNGETELLRRLAPFRPRTVLDVGANRGEWATRAATLLPEATIHAFEICPDTARELTNALEPFAERVIVNAFGLGDAPGTMTVSTFANSTVNTIIPLGEADHGLRLHAAQGRASTIEAMVDTGDRYVARAGLDRIDLLKIDVEGAEGHVLRGFSKTLVGSGIEVIQVEYNQCAIWSHFLLRDLYEMLVPLGFALGRLGPGGVAFSDYTAENEDFCGPNYVAVHRRRDDIIAALRCEPSRLA